jgi:hypothetical protein
MRKLLWLVGLLVVLITADAAHVCHQKDCSDIVGEFLVRDNRMSSKIITHRHHLDTMELNRKRRVDIFRRDRAFV